jgi:hypothetical protein
MRIRGAMISPGREDDINPIIKEPFDYYMPELEGTALVAFLHTFVALWPEIDKTMPLSPITLSPVRPATCPLPNLRISYSGGTQRRAVRNLGIPLKRWVLKPQDRAASMCSSLSSTMKQSAGTTPAVAVAWAKFRRLGFASPSSQESRMLSKCRSSGCRSRTVLQ